MTRNHSINPIFDGKHLRCETCGRGLTYEKGEGWHYDDGTPAAAREEWELGPPIHHGGIQQREVRRKGLDPFNGGHVCTAAEQDAHQIVNDHTRAALVERLVDVLQLFLAMGNCNYDLETMRRSGLIEQVKEVVRLTGATPNEKPHAKGARQ